MSLILKDIFIMHKKMAGGKLPEAATLRAASTRRRRPLAEAPALHEHGSAQLLWIRLLAKIDTIV
jgi:hypothetical protein